MNEKLIIVVTNNTGLLYLKNTTRETLDKDFVDVCKKFDSRFFSVLAEDEVKAILEDGLYTTTKFDTVAVVHLDGNGEYSTI